MRKYWEAYTIWLQNFTAYPARVVIWTLEGSITFAAFPFIWLAVYGSRETVENLTRQDIIVYYILAAVITLAVQSYVGNRMRREIITGKVSTTLVKPYSYLTDAFIATLAYKTSMMIITLTLLGIGYLILPQNTYIFPPNILHGVLFLLSLMGAFAISHLIQLIIGISTFWLGENTAPRQMIGMITIVFSGELAPLVFYPGLIQKIAAYSPFPYMLSFPIDVYLGKTDPAAIATHFVILFIWIIALTTLVKYFWNQGLRKHEAAGI